MINFKSKYFSITLTVALLLLTHACETPEKVLKSTDLDYKYNKAMHWYNKKDYAKAIPVLEELMGLYKGTKSTEELYYYYATANFKQGDYMLSAYHYKNFFNLYPASPYAEECLFMHARSNDKISPKAELEQTYTYKALEAYQLFVNTFPESKRVDTCNTNMTRLRKKLEKKALANAELYYRTGNFRAAATTFENLMVQYPDIDNTERITFMIVKSNFKFAENSVVSKKAERYKHVVDSYKDFKYKFPESKYLPEASAYEQTAHFNIVKSLVDYGPVAKSDEKVKILNQAIREAEFRKPFLKDTRQKELCADLAEKAAMLIIRVNLSAAEDKKDEAKLKQLEKAVESYYTFADRFASSRYQKNAEKLFRNATQQIEKLKQNG